MLIEVYFLQCINYFGACQMRNATKRINYIHILLSVLLIAVMGVIAFDPPTYIAAASAGLKVFCVAVLPALFPFIFLSRLLTDMGAVTRFSRLLSPVTGKIFRTGGISSYIFIVSILSGYPVGAKLVCDCKENGYITGGEALRTSSFCSTSGPMFILGTVGAGMLRSPAAGAVIYISHLIAALINGIIYRGYNPSESPAKIKQELIYKRPDDVLSDSVYTSIISVLNIGAYITLFFILIEMLATLNIFSPIISAMERLTGGGGITEGVLYGIIEVTRGASALSALFGTNPVIVASACCGIISFGGFAIFLQGISYLKKAGVKTGMYLLTKLTHGALGFILCYMLSSVLLR